MSVDRQFGVHEIPGTEAEAPNPARQVSAGFEGQMRDYVAAIWVKISELERFNASFQEFREEVDYRLTHPSASPAAPAGGPFAPSPKSDKPWLAEGISKATWYRRNKTS